MLAIESGEGLWRCDALGWLAGNYFVLRYLYLVVVSWTSLGYSCTLNNISMDNVLVRKSVADSSDINTLEMLNHIDLPHAKSVQLKILMYTGC